MVIEICCTFWSNELEFSRCIERSKVVGDGGTFLAFELAIIYLVLSTVIVFGHCDSRYDGTSCKCALDCVGVVWWELRQLGGSLCERFVCSLNEMCPLNKHNCVCPEYAVEICTFF